MHTITTLRALAKRCGRGASPDDVETYARADLLKLFQERTELASVFGVPEAKIEAALEKIEADGKIDDLGFLTIGTIKTRLEKAKKAKDDASKIATEIAARAFVASPSLTTLRALCDAGDFTDGGFLFDRKKIGSLARLIKNPEDVEITRSPPFVITIRAPKLRYRLRASSERVGEGFDLTSI